MCEPEREILVDEAGREWVIEWVSPVFGPPVTDDDAGPATAVCARRFNRRAGDSDLTQVRTRMILGREGDSPLDPFMALSWGHPPLGGPFFFFEALSTELVVRRPQVLSMMRAPLRRP